MQTHRWVKLCLCALSSFKVTPTHRHYSVAIFPSVFKELKKKNYIDNTNRRKKKYSLSFNFLLLNLLYLYIYSIDNSQRNINTYVCKVRLHEYIKWNKKKNADEIFRYSWNLIQSHLDVLKLFNNVLQKIFMYKYNNIYIFDEYIDCICNEKREFT